MSCDFRGLACGETGLEGVICWDLLDRMLDRTGVVIGHEEGFPFDHRGVTQIMALLDLPEDVQERLLAEDEDVRGMSIREALRVAAR